MPLILKENPYRGINAHLNSALQHEPDGWSPFHTAHITHIAEALDAQLPPGYEVSLERSLQIREYHPETGERIRRPVPDVTIYDVDSDVARPGGTSGAAAAPTLTLPAIETLREEDWDKYLMAVVVTDTANGTPVARLELLSPVNKPPGDGFLQYLEKRVINLKEGTPLIELDYLHESRPVIRRLPSYPDWQPGSHAYSIVITDPRPVLEEGVTLVYGFGVDDPIPVVDIPLAGDEVLTFDFGPVYHRTMASLRYFYSRADYAREPVNVDRYGKIDQERIRARMQVVLAEHAPL